MKLEYYVIIILLIVAIALVIIVIKNKKKFALQKKHYEEKLESNQNECGKWLYEQRYEFEKEAAEQQYKYEKHIEQINKNLHNTIPLGERELIKIFQQLFIDGVFNDVTVYNHLEFDYNGNSKQIDFFIISPKGLFVVESKGWQGITYIYSRGCSNDLFNNTLYECFGKGNKQEIRVFNAQEYDSKNNDKKILLSTYNNPIAQARGYSQGLINILSSMGVEQIKNVIVFNKYKECEIYYDNKPLEKINIDNYTSIITHWNMMNYFTTHSQRKCEETSQIIEFIDHNLGYLFKMDSSNYRQSPFDLITATSSNEHPLIHNNT